MRRNSPLKNALLFSLPAFVLGMASPAAADIVVSGTLLANAVDELSSSATYVVNGMLDLHSFNNTIGALAGTGIVTNGAGGQFTTLTTGGNGTDTTFSGIIQDGTAPFAITKTGAGTMTLSGANTYVGGTVISDGTLEINDASNIGTGSINFAGGALKLDTSATVGNNVSLGSAGTINTNGHDDSFTGVVSGGGALTKTGAGTLTLGHENYYSGGTIINGGTLAISDDNQLGTGMLTINDMATLRQTNNGGIANDITLSENATIESSFLSTLSGAVQGTGSLTITGGGRTTFAGSKTYSGGTIIKNGSTIFTIGDNLGTGDITFDNGNLTAFGFASSKNILINGGGAYFDGWSHDVSLSGTITGSGQLTLDNINYATLSGHNSYSGGTLISGFTTAIISSDDNLGTGDIAFNVGTLRTDANITSTKNLSLTANSTVDTNGHDVTFSGSVSGTGYLIKNGAGTLTLSGVNTCSGGTLINGGALAINNSNQLGAGDLTLDGGALRTDADVSIDKTITLNSGGGTVDTHGHDVSLGYITGTGSLIKEGEGTLNLFGLRISAGNIYFSDYSGGTIVNGGTLAINSNADFALGSGNLMLNGGVFRALAFLFESNKNIVLGVNGGTIEGSWATYYGVISGAGNLTIDGTDVQSIGEEGPKVTLNAINTYTGDTIIRNAVLEIGDQHHHPLASISSDVDIESGVLKGQGTINGDVFNNGGTLKPGADFFYPASDRSANSLDVSGDYTQSNNAAMAVVLIADTSSILNVTGTANLSGALNIIVHSDSYVNRSYTFLTAGAISGTFSTVTYNIEQLNGFRISDLIYTPTSVSFDLIPTTPTSVDVFSSNTLSDIASSHNAGFTIFEHLNDANDNIETSSNAMTFVSLSGGGMTQEENIGGGVAGLAKALPEVMKQNGGWFKATGNLASVNSSSTASGFSSETGGFMFGVDREVEKGLRVGAAGGYDHTQLGAFNTTGTNTEDNTMRFALYASKALEDRVSVDGQLGYALHMMDADRFETNNGLTAKNSHDANELSASVQLSKAFDVDGFTIKPKAGMSYVFVSEDGYTETGAGIFNATINAKDTSSLRLFTGLGISKPVTHNGARFTPEAHIKYSYETLDSTSATSGTLLGTGFTAKGVKPSNHALSLGAGLSAKLDEDLDAFGTYDVNLPTGNTFEQTFSAGVKFRF